MAIKRTAADQNTVYKRAFTDPLKAAQRTEFGARQPVETAPMPNDTAARNQYLIQKNLARQAAAGLPGSAQAAKALERSYVMGNGTQAQQNEYRREEAKAMAAALAGRPAAAQGKDYTVSWTPDAGFRTMTAEDKAAWNGVVDRWNRGDYKAINDFQTAGNWSSYVDGNGKVNGWLRYSGDGIGGYVPVSNGRLLQNEGFGHDRNNYVFYGPGGEAYTADAGGNLTRAGNWTQAAKRSALEESIPYKMVKGTATDAERQDWISRAAPLEAARRSGALTPEQLAALERAGAAESRTRAGSQAAQPRPQTQSTGSAAADPGPRDSALSGGSTAPLPAARPVESRTPYAAAIREYDYGEAPVWDGTEYERRRDAALKRAEDMRWNYDPDTDPVWQAYRKQYRREGQRATQDALGQYAAMTGGVPSSYAMTAASQAGDYYAARLSDKLPELYDDAYGRYMREYERQLGLADAYADYGQREYDRYRDRLDQWNADRSFDYGLYRDSVDDARYADETAYDRAWNEEDRDYDRRYRQERDEVLDRRADRQWAQDLRAYADQQDWKETEWQQYLREYGDQLSDQERRWAYEMARDAVDDRRYADETAWQRALREEETAYARERDAAGDRRYDTQWQQSLREYEDEQRQQDFDNALKRLQALGYVRAEDAAILGVPAGTALGDYNAGSGSSRPSAGKTEAAASGKDAADSGRLTYAGTHPDGRKRTAGYGELKTLLRNTIVDGMGDREQLRRMIGQWAAQGRIEDYEVDILWKEFGLDSPEGTARGGASGGRALQYTK